MHDHDTDDLDMAMFDLPTRPSPAKAAGDGALERNRAKSKRPSRSKVANITDINVEAVNELFLGYGIEVKHGSGKVKV